MCGDSDILIPPDNSRTLERRIPRSTLRIFEGGGHGFPMQYPDDLVGTIRGFLAAGQD